MGTPESRHSIQVIERMMKLLDALALHDQSVSLKRLSHLTGLHPSSAHRILASMVEGRIVDRVEPGAYRLGLKLLNFGNLVRARIDVRRAAVPHMQELHAELGETVNLVMRQCDEIVYVERTSSGDAMMRARQIIGARAPLHVTAAGKVFLASDSDEGCRNYADRTGLPAYTKNTLCSVAALLAEIDGIRARGYAFDHEEAERGVSCVAAGIYDADRRMVASVSVSVPTDRLGRAWGPRVKQIAEGISAGIGHASCKPS